MLHFRSLGFGPRRLTPLAQCTISLVPALRAVRHACFAPEVCFAVRVWHSWRAEPRVCTRARSIDLGRAPSDVLPRRT